MKGIENDFIEIFYNFSIYKNQVNKSLNSLSFDLSLSKQNKDNYNFYLKNLKIQPGKKNLKKIILKLL